MQKLVGLGAAATAGRLFVAVCFALLGSALPVSAQTAGGITGTVSDTDGGVLPGVTVTAASPALIEQIRLAVTDRNGQFNIVALQPGIYSVTFTLPAFSTFVRDGIELTTGFTASVDAQLAVGSIEETITVTGAAPLVDVVSVTQRTTVSKALLETLPTASMGGSVLINMTPGLNGTARIADVGGTQGYREGMGSNANNATFHGRQGMSYNIDGLPILSVLGNGTFSFVPNPLLLGETTIETGGSAESAGNGLSINAIPREGSNTFNFSLRGLFSNGSMQSDNLTDDFIARGVKQSGSLDYHYDVGFTAGGPVARDRVWFFAAVKRQGTKSFDTDSFFNATQDTLLFTPDLDRPSFTDALQRSYAGRVTVQASQRNKVNFLLDVQNNWVFRHPIAIHSPEAKYQWNFYPSYIAQASWTMVVSNQLLLEVAAGGAISHWDASLQPEVGPNSVQVFDLGIPRIYGMGTPRDPDLDERYNQRASLTYVTGAHNFKVGVTVEELRADYGIGFDPATPGLPHPNADKQYRFFNGVPLSIVQYARPYLEKNRVNPDLALYAQDQWVLDRLTLNYGLRYEYFAAHVPAQDVAATAFLPARSFDRIDSVPAWKDFSPRLGVAYDLFGNGRTALKFNFARYLRKEGTGIPSSLNPINTAVNSVSRTWADADNDLDPDCDLANFGANGECGPISNVNFGQQNVTTRWSDEVREGFGARPANTDFSVYLQQELGGAVSFEVGYNRTWGENFRVTDNLAVEPSDYDPFCITAPVHAELPGGGGYEICGLYDVAPAKFGQVDNLIVHSSNFGDQRRVADFFSFNVDTRFQSGMLIRGGIDTGRIMTDQCFVIDSPEQMRNCEITPPLIGATQVKLQGSYPLPGDTAVSVIFQNVPTEAYDATYQASNALIAPSLGRNLAACGAAVTCNARYAVNLVQPGVNFEERRTMLDLRLTKLFTLGDGKRLQANFDMYNALNSGVKLTTNDSFGSRWRNPLEILAGRLLQVSAQFDF